MHMGTGSYIFIQVSLGFFSVSVPISFQIHVYLPWHTCMCMHSSP